MGREVRRVPKDWKHPRNEHGHFVPLFEGGEKEERLRGNFMPEWPDAERTHLMMYENVTEGTPISLAFETPEELARWLADNGASAFGHMTATYEQWLVTCQKGWACSAVIAPGEEIQSGVAALAEMKSRDKEKP